MFCVMMGRTGLVITLIFVILNSGKAGQDGKTPALKDTSGQPVVYTGDVQSDKRFYDGAVRHVVGVHHYQVMRANRSHPPEGGETGWTYNHQPYLAYWNGRFYLQFLNGQIQEHTPPTRILLSTSVDGREWSDPVVLFPEYELPEIRRGDQVLPAGTRSVMHQRMGFYVAPNGKLLASGFYSYCFSPRVSPNTGKGLGRVVREIYPDGTFGPVYFIRYNRHAGFDESNTRFPFYRESQDKDFLEACEALLADKLVTLQWWEEDRAKDGFYTIDPSAVEDPAKKLGELTTSAGAGKAFNFYHRSDGAVVGIWKNQWSALSFNDGKSWTYPVQNKTLMTCGAKTWGQRTADGKYAIVYNHSATRRNRFPLVVMTGDDGHIFSRMFCLQGEVPPKRYQGIHKNPGPQYVRGIIEGNGNPPGNYLWNVYSMNKEDIWISRTRLPVAGTVDEDVAENFDTCKSEADLQNWNLYSPRWAPVTIRTVPDQPGKFLELKDEEPYDYALAECPFPVSGKVEVQFRVNIMQVKQGSALEVEVVNQTGTRPMRLRFDASVLGMDHAQVQHMEPVRIQAGKWYLITMKMDCDSGKYDLAVDGDWIRRNLLFAEKVQSLERIIFRSGPYRGYVPPAVVEYGAPNPPGLDCEDLPGGEEKVELSRYWIDDVNITPIK